MRTSRRLWAGATLVVGAVTVAFPDEASRCTGQAKGRLPDRRVVRVLGARQIGQGGLLLLRPARGLTRAAAVVDLLHAASMLPATRIWPQFRRAEVASAGLATVSAGVGWLLSRPR